MIGSVLRGCARHQFLALADLLPPENDAGGGEGVAVASSNCALYLIGFPVLAHITLLISAEWSESQILMYSAASLSTCVPFDRSLVASGSDTSSASTATMLKTILVTSRMACQP